MSYRTLVELNHDWCPSLEREGSMLEWAEAMAAYMRACDKKMLPRGVTFKHIRHHSDPDPMQGKGDPVIQHLYFVTMEREKGLELLKRFRDFVLNNATQWKSNCDTSIWTEVADFLPDEATK